MSTSEASRLECGCGKALAFGFDAGVPFSPQLLFHADGTEVCSVPEPPAVAPAALWPYTEGVPYIPAPAPAPGREGAVSPALRTWVEPPEERDRPPVLGVLLLFFTMVVLLLTCGVAVYVWWPL